MPFPFHLLPYGMRTRFRELSTPVEVLNLQHALGDDLVGFKPILQQKIVGTVNFIGDDATSIDTSTDFEKVLIGDDNEAVIAVRDKVDFRDITTNVSKNALFNKLRLEWTWSMSITAKEVPLSLLQLFAPKMPALASLELFTDSRLGISAVINVFPKLSELRIPTFYDGWMDDLLKATNKCLTISSTSVADNYDDVFSFNPDDMFTLLKTKEKRYTIKVTFPIDAEEEIVEAAIEDMVAYMGPQFSVSSGTPAGIKSVFNVTLIKTNAPAGGFFRRDTIQLLFFPCIED